MIQGCPIFALARCAGPMPFHRFTRTFLALSLFGASTAFAADAPKKESSFGSGKAGGGVLSREALRACLAQQAQVAKTDAALPAEKATLGELHAGFVRGGDTLKADGEALDRSNAEAVTAYNTQLQARDQQIDAYQARVTAYNARVEAAKAEREAFVKVCGGRSFYEEDEAAIKRGK